MVMMNRKCILYIAMSLDGFIADEMGGVDWLNTFDSGEENNDFREFMRSIDIVLLGRATYEQMLTFGDWGYGGKKCYVFTTSTLAKDPNVEFFIGEATDLLTKLRLQPGRDIYLCGGAKLIDTFLKQNLI